MMSKLSLKMKLGVGFGVLLLLIAVMGYLSYSSAKRSSLVSEEVANDTAMTDLSGDAGMAATKEMSGARGFALSGAEEQQQEYQDGKKQIADIMDKLTKAQMDDEEKKIVSRMQQFSDQFGAKTAKAIELRRNGKEKEAAQLLFSGDMIETQTALANAIKEFDDKQNKDREKSISEQSAADDRAETMALVLAGVGILLGLVVAAVIVRSITGAIARMVALIQEVAANNLAAEDMQITSEDEIGKAGAALNGMKNSLSDMILAITENAAQVAASSEELSSTSQQITANSEETTAQAKVVSEAGGQVNTNLQTLSSGAEEMNATIGEIAKNATEAARVAGEAVAAAESANQTVSRLGDSSVEIGKVIEVITSIAQQTNLLALNATIEAARAGEAGKGFAVVANEVKELAKQTAKATEEIKQKITVIRDNTSGAVAAIGGIKGVIDKISHISTVIATAVEEQSATTSEMTRNVSEAAHGASTISDNIKGVAEAAQSTSTSVGEAQTATEHLARMANQLRELVGRFKVGAQNPKKRDEAPLMKAASRAAGAR